MANQIIAYGQVSSVAEVGKIIRSRRKQEKITQAELAKRVGVGTRFISDLENGKATIEFGRAMTVLSGLGLELTLYPQNQASSSASQPGATTSSFDGGL